MRKHLVLSSQGSFGVRRHQFPDDIDPNLTANAYVDHSREDHDGESRLSSWRGDGFAGCRAVSSSSEMAWRGSSISRKPSISRSGAVGLRLALCERLLSPGAVVAVRRIHDAKPLGLSAQECVPPANGVAGPSRYRKSQATVLSAAARPSFEKQFSFGPLPVPSLPEPASNQPMQLA
jgi:hypothetical protein